MAVDLVMSAPCFAVPARHRTRDPHPPSDSRTARSSRSPEHAAREKHALDITAEVPAWDRLYRVTANSAAKTLLCAVVPELVSAEHLGSIAWWTVEGLELRMATNDPPLVRMATQLSRVAAALVAQLPDAPHDGAYR